MRRTITGTCAKCDCRADFDYRERDDGGSLHYACRNCGLERVVRPRASAPGADQQVGMLEALGERCGAGSSHKVDRVEGVGGGRIFVVLRARSHIDTDMYLVIGPRGSLKVTRVAHYGAPEQVTTGFAAWITLRVHAGIDLRVGAPA